MIRTLSRWTSPGAVFSDIVLRWCRAFTALNHPHHGRHLDRGLCGLAPAIEFGRLCWTMACATVSVVSTPKIMGTSASKAACPIPRPLPR